MTTTIGAAPIAEPVVHHRLRRRPPSAIRSGRALLMTIAGFGITALFILFLGVLIGIKGAAAALPALAAIAIPMAIILWAVVRFTRTRTKLAFLLAIGVALLLSLVLGYLIVTMSRLLTETNSIFFAQLMLSIPFVVAVAAVWQLARGFTWFDGTKEHQLRPEESGARPISAPLTVAATATPTALAAAAADTVTSPTHVVASSIVAAAEASTGETVDPARPLLSVQGLKKHFPIYGGVLRRQIGTVYAVDGVDFEIMPGETFSLVGESGCGKTTLGRTVIQLTPSTDGRVVFDGYELADVDPDDMRPLRRRMQIIFQDPFGSLNPRMPVSDIIGEGLLSQGLSDRKARDKRVEDALELVGLRREYSRRYPHEFSGGQRQRIGVARALALGPDFIVADEPVSALDVSIQSQVLNLLLDLKRDLNLTYLFISHNLSVVQYFSDRVGVMYLGKIAEIGTVEQLYQNPRHPYTVALLSAIPEADPRRRKKRLVLRGDVPSPAAPPSGCRFHTRCWLRERLGNPENCVTVEPQLVQFGAEAGHRVACHWADEISQATVAQAEAESPAVVAAVAEDE
ncbi:MAG TPA: oligopeptide/dipeptide ABC transporter ATP-binding protein [Candidatus Limnocylindrales bacterium]|jgi:oligopeptide/dipeptide ABC transporter ATP-binding protein